MLDKKDEAFIDDLTGSYNRRFLKEYLSIEIKKYKRYYIPFTILFLDLDNFKNVNDSLGHVEGDRVLERFVNFLKDYLRKSDILVRYGGDEFIIILPHTERNAGLIVAKRIIERVKQDSYFSKVRVGVSIGVAQYPDDGKDIYDLLRSADRGLYLAKRRGKGRVFFATNFNLKPIIPSYAFVNRDKERKSLEIALTSERYRFYLIHGDIGMGKTRFIEEFFKRREDEILYGRGFSVIHNFPYYVVRDILKRLYQRRRSEFLNIYRELTPIAREHISRLLPAILEGISNNGGEKEEIEVFLHSIYTFFTLLTRKTPIFVIDDIQWIDEESANFLRYYAKQNPDIKIIGTHRKREGSSGYSCIYERFKDEMFNIELEPLKRGDVEALVKSVLGEYVDPEVIEYVYKNGGGNPYYVEEVIRALFEHGFLYPDSEGEWKLSDDVYEHSVFTPNAESIIRKKIKTLGIQHIKVLELMAVYGEIITIDKLSHILSIGEGELYNILDEMERAGLLQHESFKNYMFAAGMIRDIILKEMSKGKKIYYHKKVLEYYEEFVPKSEIEEKSAFLAYHYKMIGEIEKAIRFYNRSAENALKVFAFRSAIRYFNESYELAPDNDTLFKIANTYYLLGEFKKSLRILEGLVEKEPDNYKYLLKLADVHEVLNNLEESEKITRFILKHANSEEHINPALMQLAWIRQREGKIEEAIEIYKKVFNSLREKKDDRLIAKVYQELGICYRRLGKLKEAEEHFIAALETEHARRNRLFYLITKLSLSSVILNKGYYEDGIDILKELKDEFKKIGSMYYYCVSLINLASVYSNMGKTERVYKLLEVAKDYVEQTGNKYFLSYIYVNLADISFEFEDLKSAAEYIEKSLEINSKYIETLYNMLYLAVIYTRMGKLEKSMSVLNEYMKLKKSRKAEVLKAYELRRLLEIALIKGDEDIWDYIEEAKKFIQSGENGNDILYITLYIALWFAKRGERKNAKKYLEIAINKFSEAKNFNILDFHELLMEIYGYLGDKTLTLKEFNLLRDELVERKNFKRLEKLERKIEEFLR